MRCNFLTTIVALASIAQGSFAADRIVVASWDMEGVAGYHEEFNDESASIGRGALDQTESGSHIFRSNGGTVLNSRIADGGQRIRFWNAAHGASRF